MNLENLKILLVDDDGILREMMAASLVFKGFRKENVKQAHNGLEALQILESFIPDLVITDYNMPFFDGIDLVKALRETEGFKHIPIAFHSANSSIAYICHRENIDAYILDFPAKTKDIIKFIEELFPEKE